MKSALLPKTKEVSGTNFCDIALKVVGERAIIISAIDNLIKGASGVAIQNPPAADAVLKRC